MMKILDKSTNYLFFSEGEETFLSIPTGIQQGRHELKLISAIKNEPGWMIGNQTQTEWFFSGYRRIEDEIYLYGPLSGGKSLEEVMDFDPEEGLPYLLRLVRAIGRLQEKQIEPFPMQSGGIFFLENEDVLIPSTVIMNKIKDYRTQEYQLRSVHTINNPFLKVEQKASFTIAVLVYRLFAGEFPFNGDTDEIIRDKIRSFPVVPLSLSHPEFEENISETVSAALKKPESISLKDWEKALEDWILKGVHRELSDDQRTALTVRAKEEQTKSDRAFGKRLFFEKNGRLLIGLTVGLAVFGLFLGSILRNALAPRQTRGFPPEQVVSTFYESMGIMDHMMMEDCVIGDAGKGEINEALNLFLLSKQFLVYDQQEYIIPADKWDENDRPTINPPYWVHGVLNLDIEEVEPLPDPVYLVTYEKWTRQSEDSPIRRGGIIYEGWQVRDKVSVKQHKQDWVIHELERLDWELIEPTE